eukprot:scaffold10980_cov125-Isochrysis_galbana.AAC.4
MINMTMTPTQSTVISTACHNGCSAPRAVSADDGTRNQYSRTIDHKKDKQFRGLLVLGLGRCSLVAARLACLPDCIKPGCHQIIAQLERAREKGGHEPVNPIRRDCRTGRLALRVHLQFKDRTRPISHLNPGGWKKPHILQW